MSVEQPQVVNPDDGVGCMFVLIALVLLGAAVAALILILFLLFG